MFRNILSILRFGQPYLKRYWVRFAAGILLGALFGLSNASFIWATQTLFKRLAPVEQKSTVELRNEGDAPVQWSAKTSDTNAVGSLQGVIPPNTTTNLTFENKKKESLPVKGRLAERAAELQVKVEDAIDPWLPQVGRQADWRQLLGGFLLLPLLVAIRSFVGFLSSYCVSWVSARMMNDLRYDVLAKLYQLSLDFFNRSTMGDLLTRINNDTGWLGKAMTNGVSDIVKEPFTIVAALAALLLLDWKLTLVAVFFLPICVVPLVILGKKIRRATKASVSANASQSSLLVEAISSIRVLKAFGLEADSLKRFGDYSRQIVHHDMKSMQARELVNPLVETISMLGLGLLIVFIFTSGTQLHDLAAFLTGVILMFAPIKKLAGVHVLFQQAGVGIDHLRELFAEVPSVKELPKGQKLAGFAQEIRFEGVSFAYKDKTIIRDLNLTIPCGTKLGVVGETGSGKSTLVNLLLRFYDPTQGSIKIDGQDMRQLSSASLREHMALVSQEIVIFDLSVADNIACGKKGATREEVITAAKSAHAHEFIERMTEGYDTKVAERGTDLAGGQRQRISIARAFIRNAPILVLDEATANLDARTEGEVQAAIDQLEKNRTVICVAHRISTLRTMDRIIVLDEGKIIEDGSFSELLARGGRFCDLARRQGIYSA
ncbi:MAG: ABC transporter ATP-binding protein [Verrucomicrobiota bacterium]